MRLPRRNPPLRKIRKIFEVIRRLPRRSLIFLRMGKLVKEWG